MTDLFHDADSETQAPASRRDQRDRGRKASRAAQRRRSVLTFVIMVVALVGLVFAGWRFVSPLFEESEPSVMDYPGPGSGSATITVEQGDSGAEIGATLVEADVVATVDAFVRAYNSNPDASGIQPGEYMLQQQIPAAEAVEALLDPASRVDLRLTVPEGWRATQIYAGVAEQLEIDTADVEAAAADLELPEQADGSVEGWLFASTYTIDPDGGPLPALQQMVDMTVTVLERNDIPRDQWHDVIIVSSIIEREVSQEGDRPLVAQVIENRLQYCNDSGELEMDSTLAYELGKPASEITTTEWNTASDYNTRTFAGLPPTAISSPSESAIQAAADPPEGDYCYFVTVNTETGETKFTADYEEFLDFKAEYEEYVAGREDDGA